MHPSDWCYERHVTPMQKQDVYNLFPFIYNEISDVSFCLEQIANAIINYVKIIAIRQLYVSAALSELQS